MGKPFIAKTGTTYADATSDLCAMASPRAHFGGAAKRAPETPAR
jgi:hypothetical protein